MARLSINGETVEAHELWKGRREELSAKAGTLPPQGYRAYLERRAAQLITDKIAETLLYQEASSKLSPETTGKIEAYVDGEIRKIVAAEYDGVERRYVRYLESQGRKLDDVRAKLRREIVISSYMEREVKPKVPEPTRAELLAAFEASADSLRRPPRRRMSLIDVRITDRLPPGLDNPTREQFEAARGEALSRIRTAQTELESGIVFAEVAGRYSDGLHAAEGGAWGWVTRGSVRERFEPAVETVFKMDAGQVSDIIETTDGFFIVRCDEVDPGYEPDFASAQPELADRLFREAYNRLIMELVAKLRRKAHIEPADIKRFHAAVVEAALDLAAPPTMATSPP